MKKRHANAIEHRTFPLSMTRAASDAPSDIKLTGHAAVFGQTTVLVPRDTWFQGSPEIREVIEAGAFAKTLQERDVRALWNHNSDIVLGRKGNKTLALAEDKIGLYNEIQPPDTQLVRDMVLAPIERGDVNQMSFGFRIVRDKVVEEDNTITFILKELDLVEVSPCTIPQYTGTDIGLSARSADRLEDIRQRCETATTTSPATAPPAEGHPEVQQLPTTSDATEHPEQRSAPPTAIHLDEQLFCRLEIAQRQHV